MAEAGASDNILMAGRRAGLALYRLAWGLLLLAALAMPLLSAIELATLPGPVTGSAAIPALPFRLEAWLLFALNLVPAVFLTVAAALLFRRCGRDLVAMILAFSFLCSAASMPFVEPWLIPGRMQALREALEYFAPLTGILGMMLFPDGRFVQRWMIVPALLLLPWTAVRMLWGLPLPLDVALNDAFGATVIVSAMVRYRRLVPGSPSQQQLRWALFGIIIGLVLNNLAMALFVRMSLPLDDLARSWMLLAARALLASFYIAMAGGLLVSLLRYRLYDADAIITRSAALAATTVLLGAVFAATAEGIKWLVERGLDQDAGLIPGVAAAGTAALLVSPAHERLRDWAEARFQRGLHRMRVEVPQAAGDWRETAALPELLEGLLARIAAGSRAQRGAFLLVRGKRLEVAETLGCPDDDVSAWLAGRTLAGADADPLSAEIADPLFPLRIALHADPGDTEPLGWILLGPRPDGSFYGRDERAVLAEIAGPVASAIRIVEVRAARERRALAVERRQERRIAELERRLAALGEAPGEPRRARSKTKSSPASGRRKSRPRPVAIV